MRLHDPLFEKSLHAAVESTALASPRPIAFSKGRSMIARWINTAGGMLVVQAWLCCWLLAILGATDPQNMMPGRRSVIVGLWFFAGAIVIRDNLLRESFYSAEAKVLWMLPFPGEGTIWRAIQRTLWRTWPTLLRAWLACIFLQDSGFSLGAAAWVRGFLNGVALWMITLAMASLQTHPIMAISRWNRAGRMLYRAAQLLLGIITADTVYRWHSLALHAWLETAAPVLTWLLPPSWIATTITGRPDWLYAIATLVLVGLGIRHGLRWPKLAARAFDSLPQTPALEEIDEEESAVADHREAPARRGIGTVPEDHLRPGDTAQSLRTAMAQPEVSVLLAHGWIQRLVLWTLSARDRAILPVLMQIPPRWSKHWLSAAKGLAMLLGVTLISRQLIMHFHLRGPSWDMAYSSLFGIACIGSGALLLLSVVPLGGDASQSIRPWPSGAEAMPLFCGFPVVSWDFLRISWKIVGIRTLAAALLAVPAASVLGWQAAGEWRAGVVAASLTLRVLWLIFTLRPVLVVYRFGTAMKRHGAWLATISSSILIFVLFMVWVVAAGTFAALAAADAGDVHLSQNSQIWSLGLALAAVLPNLAIFECSRWRLRHSGLDFGG